MVLTFSLLSGDKTSNSKAYVLTTVFIRICQQKIKWLPIYRLGVPGFLQNSNSEFKGNLAFEIFPTVLVLFVLLLNSLPAFEIQGFLDFVF